MGLRRECRFRVPILCAFAAAPVCHKNHKPRYPDEKDVPGREDTGTSRGASFLDEMVRVGYMEMPVVFCSPWEKAQSCAKEMTTRGV